MARNVALVVLGAWVVTLPESHALDGPWSLGPGVVLGRLTLVLGATCTWACVVQVVQRRRMIFSFDGV
jgi:hypothetical protein